MLPAWLRAQGRSVDWPVYSGSDEHIHYSTLDQITPDNVHRLQVAWTYETHDQFAGSEMQANPIVIDGVLYATTPKLCVIALDTASGKEIWSFDPNTGALEDLVNFLITGKDVAAAAAGNPVQVAPLSPSRCPTHEHQAATLSKAVPWKKLDPEGV